MLSNFNISHLFDIKPIHDPLTRSRAMYTAGEKEENEIISQS